MKLSQTAIDKILMIISNFDRERGVPHDYVDLEVELKTLELESDNGQLNISKPKSC